MDVGVRDGLARGRAVVDPDVEGLRLELPKQQGADLRDQPPDLCLNIGGQVKQARDMGAWNDQAVAAADREAVQDGGGVLAGQQKTTARTKPS